MPYTPIELSIINSENENFKDRPLAFEGQIGFPYNELQPRDFERLVFCIYKAEILKRDSEKDYYDEIQLMQGVGERGRDCVFLNKGIPVGLIQCKRYRNNIDVSEVGKEIVKFVLHYTQDNSLIPNPDNFTYNVAVSYGYSEKALELINSLKSRTVNKMNIECWAEEVIKQNKKLNLIVFDNVKDTLFNVLNRIEFEKINPDDLNMLIEKNTEIKSMFFELKSVIDVISFNRLLIEREKDSIRFFNTGMLERTLEGKNKYLFNRLEETKKQVELLVNEYSANFVLYTHHNKKHTQSLSMLLGSKILDQEFKDLNEDELYVLSAAAYLHDIGICTENEYLENKYREYKESKQSYNTIEIDEYIRQQHSYFTYEFILDNWEFLKLESKWKDAIALVAGQNNDVDIFEYKYFEYAPDGGRIKVCIPYLHSLIKISDMLDIENINANYLLRDYSDMREYKESKKMWEEEMCSIKSNVTNGDRIVYEGQCDNQLIYIALNRHIQETKYVMEQLIAKVQKYRSDYKFSIHFIEENLVTPFEKKMGFSVDYIGIARTFIGKNIYQDSYDAIREVIQNAIDSCDLRQSKDKEYNPIIEVELTDTEIIIKDNGLGMDEYIVGNYFSKLCKSYYKEFGIDSIGQFGIGVFSYFMMCNSFSVETKTQEGQKLSFNAYNSLNSLFYFYDNNASSFDQGTIITFKLKDEIIQEISFEKLVNKVEDFFRFVDIPILLIKGDINTIIKKNSLSWDIEEELIDQVKYQERDEIKELVFLESHIDDELFEGICGVPVKQNSTSEYIPFQLNDILYNMTSYKGRMLLCQKGIKVIDTSYGDLMRWNQVFNLLLGKINIKKNLNINLSRNRFQDKYMDTIINKFEIDLLNKFFISIHQFEPREAYSLNSELVHCYIDHYRFPFDLLEDFILNNFYVMIFTGEIEEYMLFSDFIAKYQKFIFVGGKIQFKNIASSLATRTEIPVMYIGNESFCSFYFDFFEKTKFTMELHDEIEGILIIIKSEERKPDYSINYKMGIKFGDNLLFNKVDSIGYGHIFYNNKHPLIQLYIANAEEIKNNRSLFDKFNRFFKFVGNVCGIRPEHINLSQTNIYLNEITDIFGVQITLGLNDFPEKYRKYVLNN